MEFQGILSTDLPQAILVRGLVGYVCNTIDQNCFMWKDKDLKTKYEKKTVVLIIWLCPSEEPIVSLKELA